MKDGGWSAAISMVVVAAIFGFVFLSRSLGEGFAIPVALFSIVGGAIVLRGPVGKALARRLEGDQAALPGPSEDVLVELDDLRARVLELEERVDFSERLLASQRQAADQGQGPAA